MQSKEYRESPENYVQRIAKLTRFNLFLFVKHSCSYLSEKYGVNMRTESVCLVDDDNDMELAVACLHAFIPGMASISVVENMMKYPKQFTQTFVPGRIEMTKATDAALENILRNVRIKREHP